MNQTTRTVALFLLLAAPLCHAQDTTGLLPLVNAERAQRGRKPLVIDAALQAGAQRNADWMQRRGRLSHSGPFQAWSAENAAWGYPTPQAVVAGWMASRGHRANILGPYTRVGFGRAGKYWVADFR